MDPKDITPDLLPEEPQLSPAGDEGTVDKPSEAPATTLTLEQINKELGKDFKDLPTALKSVKDTYNYVGKRKEDIIKEVQSGSADTAKEIREIKENLFFKDNPQYAPYRAIMMKLGDNPASVAEMPEFKTTFEKAKGYDDSQNLRSVLVSNPRLAASKDTLTKAREAGLAGNNDERDTLVGRAVLESLQ